MRKQEIDPKNPDGLLYREDKVPRNLTLMDAFLILLTFLVAVGITIATSGH